LSVSEIKEESSLTPTESRLYATAEALSDSLVLPFSEQAKAPIKELSRELMTSSYAMEHPQLRVLGYWLRPASINALCEKLKIGNSNLRVARGLAVHWPPENVDTIFAYSWAVSCLMGNSNLTRLPSKMDSTAAWLVELLNRCIERTGQSGRHVFCQFDTKPDVELDA